MILGCGLFEFIRLPALWTPHAFFFSMLRELGLLCVLLLPVLLFFVFPPVSTTKSKSRKKKRHAKRKKSATSTAENPPPSSSSSFASSPPLQHHEPTGSPAASNEVDTDLIETPRYSRVMRITTTPATPEPVPREPGWESVEKKQKPGKMDFYLVCVCPAIDS